MGSAEVGVVGLGVMGRNLALNLAEKGFSVVGWDAWREPVDRLVRLADEARHTNAAVHGERALPAFVASLVRPRRIIMLVKAGDVAEQTIGQLLPLLEAGDILIDGGNEHFRDTERRAALLARTGVRFLGMGVSGGEEGARHGPSLMPGGDRSAYDEVAAMLARIAAQVPDGPCVAYCGPGGAGHYVKMVHNGIEYGVMQLIAEAYDLLRRLGGLSNAALAATFAAWNRGELESYLLGITARIFTTIDPDTGHDLVDEVVDAAAQKGTGRWAVSDAAEIGVPVPTIAAAVDARLLSAERDLRLDAARRLPGPRPAAVPAARSEALVSSARAALYAAELCTYAQGMDLLRAASALRGWQLSLAELARIWKGGCIIRARLLSQVQEAFERDGALPNLLVDADLDDELGARQQPWREVLADGALSGVPVPALAASLGYYDMLRTPRLPANLTQAQRDYFGAHGYQRLDRPGAFHTSWSAEAEPPDPTSLR